MKHQNDRNRHSAWWWVVIATLVFLFPATAPCQTTQTAVVATQAADFSSGDHSLISVDPVGGPRTVQENMLPTVSDVIVAAHENYFYRIERFQANNVTKFDIAAPATPIYQYSVLDSGESGEANPHAMVFLNSQKAYVLRYGQPTAWIVNPSATSEEQFKIGELDLSAYADSDGIPEMEDGVIVGNKLFITLARLDRDDLWAASNTGYVAVFDTSTDTEIDTGISNADGVKGIPLSVKNPGSIQYLSGNNTLYVRALGSYASYDGTRPPGYTGGITTIDPSTYAASLLVDDGDSDNHPYGNITGMSVVSADKGYFVGYGGWGDNTLYGFSPTSGVVSGAVHDDLSSINIAGMESGAYADQNDMLWVCDQTNSQIVILDTADDTIDEKVSTFLNPVNVAFSETAPINSDGGYTVVADLWLKAVFQTPGGPITLKWNQAGSSTTPSGDTVVAGYFYADPGDFEYGNLYNPEAFVKIYISTSGWANIVFNHVTVDNIDVYSAHQYDGTPENSSTITLESVKVDHTYTGVSMSQ